MDQTHYRTCCRRVRKDLDIVIIISPRCWTRRKKSPTTLATAGLGGWWSALAERRPWGHAVVGLGHRPRGLEAPTASAPGHPHGWRRLLQDLRRVLDTIFRLSGCRRSRAPRHRRRPARRRHSKGPTRVGTVSGPLPTASAAGLGPDQGGGPRRRRLEVVKLLPGIGQTSGAAEGGYKDEGTDVRSSVRRRLLFTTPQEEPRLARAWRDLESQAEPILPKTVRARALALLRRLTDGGYIS